jgi:hypothetical protein
MGLHIHLPLRRRIDRLFASDLNPKDRARTIAAVDDCPQCAAYYRTMQALESSLCGVDEPYTHFSIERSKKALFDALDASNTTASNRSSPLFTKLTFGLRWVLVPTALAAIVLLLVLGKAAPKPDRVELLPNEAISPVTWVARGSFPKKAEADIGIRLFRVTDGGTAVDESRGLSIDDIITFTYTQANPQGGTFMLFGVQDTGEVHWYYPSDGEKESIAVKGDKVDEPLKDGILLRTNHTKGKLRVTAIFSKTPVLTSDIEAAVSAMRRSPEQIMNLSPIVLVKDSISPIQYSVIVTIGDGK